MKKAFTLSLPQPCKEKWSEFQPTNKGGFCASCQKEVIDFTSWSEEEIKKFFLNSPGKTCGKLNPDQIKTYFNAAPVKRNWRTAIVLAIISLWFSRQTNAQAIGKPVTQEQVDHWRVGEVSLDTTTQNVIIEGRVFDAADSTPIPGANVIRKGTIETVVTDAEGKFKFIMKNAGPSERLAFSFIGYKTKEITISAASQTIELNLEMDELVMGDVVVGVIVATHRFSPRRWWGKLKNLFR